MKNLDIFLPLVNGEQLPLNFPNGRELIHKMVSDDFAAPPLSLCFEATTDDGKIVRITIPYNESNKASVIITY